MRFHRLVLLAAAPLALAALLGSTAPAGAAIIGNALTATGSALGDLDGVAVEAVVLPDAR